MMELFLKPSQEVAPLGKTNKQRGPTTQNSNPRHDPFRYIYKTLELPLHAMSQTKINASG